ncbi:MAG TPA: YHS domain-containing protein, partial [Candidatus Babeliaceae bacterium]|nr:YHS domain-containing protein [Candidatus Babeliaceae bacterium]
AAASPEIADSIRHAELNKLTIVNENDPACGMPLLRGFDDTATYQGKLIGFCSKECRDSFLRKPEAFAIKYKK